MKEPSRGELVRRCREAGLKATPQRLAIYRALLRTCEHPSPEAVFKAVRPSMPSLSLATVYKTLDALQRAGLVEEVSRLGETKRYDANLHPHHHLICTRCNKIIDVELEGVEKVIPLSGRIGSFTATEIHVQLRGLCESCDVPEERRST